MRSEVFHNQLLDLQWRQRNAESEAERYRAEFEAIGRGPGREQARSCQVRAEAKADRLALQVDLARRQVTLSEVIEQQRSELGQRYQEHNGRPVKANLVSHLNRAHDRLAVNEARLRRANRQLVELDFVPVWTPATLAQFKADDELLESEDDLEAWVVIPELSGRRYYAH